MITCPNCAGVIASAQDRPPHAIIVQSVRIRRGDTVQWAMIASCNAAVVGTGPTYDAALLALDGRADALNCDILPSRARTGHHTPALTLQIDEPLAL